MRDPRIEQELSRRQVGLWLALICLVGLGLRVYHALAAVIVSPDSALFIEYARRLGSEPLGAVRDYHQHPLYPVLIWLLHFVTGWFADGPGVWILAGRLAAIGGSLAALLAMYWLGARCYDRRRGLLAAALLAVLPDACRYGADVLTDLPHLALYLSGLAALLSGLRPRRAACLPLSAALAALAFLTRPEGGAVLVIGLVAVALQRAWALRRRLGLAVAMLAAFFCLTAPYQLATGRLVQKKSPLELLDLGSAGQNGPGPAATGQTPSADARGLATGLPVPIDVLRQWFRAGRVVYVLLALVGVAVWRPRGPSAAVLAGAFGVHLALLHALELRWGYLDRRHALILAALSLPPAAAGATWLSRRLAGRAGRQRVAAGGILAFCVAVTSPWLLRPINAGQRYVAASAAWVAGHTPAEALIVGDSRMRRVALCADRAFAEWPWWGGSVRHLARFLRQQDGAVYFLVDVRHITLPSRNPRFFDELSQRLGRELELVHTEPADWPENPTELRIYRYQRNRPAPAP